ncbi:MAG: site-specific integrase, partial [Planctomycetota bacterium]|nr:site-specific integrase [Planctomycetota bacterium]
ERMLQTIPRVVGERRAESWRRFLIGLWWSGLRIEEALRLTCDQEERLMVDLTRRRPMLWIPAAMQKSHKNTLLPLAPEFAEFLLATPEAERTGFVFNPLGWRLNDHRPIKTQQAIRTICAIGVKAGVKVGTNDKGDPQYASAHDCRRAFGDRWSKRVMPAVLKELMRHASINTTMSFYVTGDAQATAELLWESVQVDTLVDTCRFPADPPPSEETEKQHNPL